MMKQRKVTLSVQKWQEIRSIYENTDATLASLSRDKGVHVDNPTYKVILEKAREESWTKKDTESDPRWEKIKELYENTEATFFQLSRDAGNFDSFSESAISRKAYQDGWVKKDCAYGFPDSGFLVEIDNLTPEEKYRRHLKLSQFIQQMAISFYPAINKALSERDFSQERLSEVINLLRVMNDMVKTGIELENITLSLSKEDVLLPFAANEVDSETFRKELEELGIDDLLKLAK